MSPEFDGASRHRLYSQKLVGFEGPGCSTPACGARRALTTGWLEQEGYGEWLMEFECPDHGTSLTIGGPGEKVIAEVLVDNGFRVYSRELLGYHDDDCKVPKCRAPRAPSTGWLERRGQDWYMEFECPDHGPALMGGGPWSSLIADALRRPDEGPTGLVHFFLRRLRGFVSPN
jgi:hypothetical protein